MHVVKRTLDSEHNDWQQVKYLDPIEMVAHDQPFERVTWLHLTKREFFFFNSLVEVSLPTDVPWHDLHDLFPEDLRHEVCAFSFCQHDGL